jgi:ABC-type phosphate transport system substrate-binding protein
MRRRGRWVLLALLLTALSLARAEPPQQPIAIVVSAAWETPREIDLAALRHLYRGRLTRWAGRSVERYELALGSAARAAFIARVMGLSERELEDYWLEQALSGGAIPPRELASAAEMRRAIAERAGAIGYLPFAAVQPQDGVQLRVLAVRVDGAAYRPGDPRYPIQMPSEAAQEAPPRERAP